MVSLLSVLVPHWFWSSYSNTYDFAVPQREQGYCLTQQNPPKGFAVTAGAILPLLCSSALT